MRIKLNTDGADASRRAIGLRIAIRFLSGASRLAIKRMQRSVVRASKLACPPAADPQPVGRRGEVAEACKFQCSLEV